jgi:hypothetical protein
MRRITFLHFRCKLYPVRRRQIAKTVRYRAVLLVLLALQLVLGLQLQVAQAVAAPVPMPSVPVAAAAAQLDCPTHSAHDAKQGVQSAANHATGMVEHASTGSHAPMGTHDCCHASACQCHCVYTPVAIDLPALGDIETSDSVPSLAGAQFVAPRIDEFLRPPIA